jgi:hypothetical protein
MSLGCFIEVDAGLNAGRRASRAATYDAILHRAGGDLRAQGHDVQLEG